MTAYVMNPFAQWQLPTFDPTWREACESCVYCRVRGGGLYCSHAMAQTCGHTACIDARTRACGPAATLRKERAL